MTEALQAKLVKLGWVSSTSFRELDWQFHQAHAPKWHSSRNMYIRSVAGDWPDVTERDLASLSRNPRPRSNNRNA